MRILFVCVCVCCSSSRDGTGPVDLVSFSEFMDLLVRVAARMPPQAQRGARRRRCTPLSLVGRLFHHLDQSRGLHRLLTMRRNIHTTERMRRYVMLAM